MKIGTGILLILVSCLISSVLIRTFMFLDHSIFICLCNLDFENVKTHPFYDYARLLGEFCALLLYLRYSWYVLEIASPFVCNGRSLLCISNVKAWKWLILYWFCVVSLHSWFFTILGNMLVLSDEVCVILFW